MNRGTVRTKEEHRLKTKHYNGGNFTNYCCPGCLRGSKDSMKPPVIVMGDVIKGSQPFTKWMTYKDKRDKVRKRRGYKKYIQNELYL